MQNSLLLSSNNVDNFAGTKFINGASFVTDWTSSDLPDTSMNCDSRKKNTKYRCPDPLCISEFDSETDKNIHITADDHQYATPASGMDEAILCYATQKHIQNTSSHTPNSSQMDIDDVDCFDLNHNEYLKVYVQGWARKKRIVQKVISKQKEFIEKLFINGARAKTKSSAEQMAERMKDELVDGSYYFLPTEYLDAKRIRNIITGLRK